MGGRRLSKCLTGFHHAFFCIIQFDDVAGLLLSNNKLSGTLPSELGKLFDMSKSWLRFEQYFVFWS